MSEIKIYPPPPGFAARALINAATLRLDVPRVGHEHGSVLGQASRERLTWSKPFTQVKDTSFDAKDLHVRWFADGELNVSVELPRPPSREAPRADRDPLGARRPARLAAAHQLSRAARERLQVLERAEAPRRQERRPRHDLHADDSRDGDRDARLRAHRRRPLGRVRRFLARSVEGPHRGLRVARRHHGRRRRARRQESSAESQRRRGAQRRARHDGRARRRRAAHGRQHRVDARPRPVVRGRPRWRFGRLPGRADERRGSAIHSLYVGLDG